MDNEAALPVVETTPENPIFPAPPDIFDNPNPVKVWLLERFTLAGRAARSARGLAAQVNKALSNPKSAAGVAVMAVAQAVAQGMLARHMDDRGWLRCAWCLTTHDLRVVGKTKTNKKIYACPIHRDEIHKRRGAPK